MLVYVYLYIMKGEKKKHLKPSMFAHDRYKICKHLHAVQYTLCLQDITLLSPKLKTEQGTNARKVNCSCVYTAHILKPVLSGRNL